MKMTGQYHISARRDAVWLALNDPAVLSQAIPGCESIVQTSEMEMDAIATAKVGPVKAKFKGRVTLSDLNPPDSYTIQGEGKGGAAGFVKGSARVRLTEEHNMTVLSYDVEARVGGKLAQVGQRLIDQAAKKMADDFFEAFAQLAGAQSPGTTSPKALNGGAPRDALAVPAQSAETGSGLSPAVWISGLIVFIIALALITDKLPTGFPQF